MESDGRRDVRLLCYSNEGLFSLNLAFASVSLLFLAREDLSVPFIGMEVSLKQLLGMPQSDQIRGYFYHWIPSILLGVSLWLALRLLSRTITVDQLLRSVAGFVALCSTPVFWFFLNQKYGWHSALHFWLALVELPTVLVSAFLFLSGKWHPSGWYGIPLLAGHFLLWFWILGNVSAASYVGPAGPILGFCSATAWAFYVSATLLSHGVPQQN